MLFQTNNIETVKDSQQFFRFNLPSILWTKRCKNFDAKYGV